MSSLFESARNAREKAYAPYSGHKVGAAIRTQTGRVYMGCNVENSSFGGTVCAERVAIQNAVSEEGGRIRITEIHVVTDATPPWPPCGLCRQVIAEFAEPELPIHASNLAGATSTSRFDELLPQAFTPAHLNRR